MALACAASAQNVLVSPGSGSYLTLKDAFDAINAGTHTGSITISIVGNTNETASSVLNASGIGSASYTSVHIIPTGLRTVSGNLAAPLIDLNGASDVTIDGQDDGDNSLTFSNTSTSAIAPTSTIRFVNGAQNDLVTNCSILGSTTGSNATATANVLFHTSTGAGNSNNTISFCNLGPAGPNLPSKCVMGLGSSTAVNSNDAIHDNNIFDFFNPVASVSGISIQTDTNNWTVADNRIYQTAPRVFTNNNARYSGITITNGSGSYIVTDNIIGFGANDGTGVTSISGLTNTIRGIDATSVSTTTPTAIQGNVISGISQSTATAGGGTTTNFVGLMLGSTDGRFFVTDNRIGSLDGSSSITVNSSAGSGPVIGIYDFSFQSNTVSNNTVGSITIGGTGTRNGIRGILVNTGNSVLELVNNNIVANITDNQVGDYAMYGIQVALPATSMNGNVVRNITGNANGATVVMSGISISSGSATVASTIAHNTVHSLTNSASGGSAGSAYAVDLTLPAQMNVIDSNLVHSIDVVSGLPAYQIWGIVMRGSGSATFQNNMVRLGLKPDGSSITTGYSVVGIRDIAGATSNYYHNSVYLGGTNVAAVSNTYAFLSDVITNTRAFINNVFYNGRSNASGGIANAAISVGGSAPNPAGLTSNFNVLYANGVDGITGIFNSIPQVTLANWRAATGQDGSSRFGNPQFIAPNGTAATGDLHIQSGSSTTVEGAGTLVASVTMDFDGQSRSTLTPVDIGADAGNFTVASTNANLSNMALSSGILSPAFSPAILSYTASVANAISSITVTPTVQDANATVMVNGNPVTSGNASGPITLSIGHNVVPIVVTAQDNATTRTYTVDILRAGNVNITATAGQVTDAYGTLADAFHAINVGGPQGAITISIDLDTTEASPATLNASGSGSA